MVQGSLVVVGTGMRLVSQCTPESQSAIEQADIVFAVVDPVVLHWLQGLNARVISMQPLYGGARLRRETYDLMVETILDRVRAGDAVCAVFYGHPGVFVRPSRLAIEQARAEGFTARMLPGISAEDCLCADLCVDPGAIGLQSYEATDFVINARLVDTTAALILWQIGVVGEFGAAFKSDRRRLALLSEVLCETYPPDHEVTVYEAATLPTTSASVQRVQLCALQEATVTQASTLYVPPLAPPRRSAERLALLKARLG